MLHPVSHGSRALATKSAQISRRRAGDYGVRLFRQPALESTGAFHDERTASLADPRRDPFQADESRRPVGPVHHQILDLAYALDVAAPVSYTHLRAHETPEHLVC